MKATIKRGFNLIEITLAVAIIAVGMSSILVLFPVGLNASSAAAADNMVQDVAEYILGYLECRTQAAWRDAAGNATANAFVGSLPDSLSDADDSSVTWTTIANTKLESGNLGGSTVFRYVQSYNVVIDGDSTTVTDFSAVIRVWKEKIPLLLRKTDNTTATQTTDSPASAGTYGMTLCAEISFPVEKPYADREKYLFRREIYNHAK